MGQLVSSISLRPFFSLHDRLQECRNFGIRGWNCSFHTLTLGKPGMTWGNLLIPAFGSRGKFVDFAWQASGSRQIYCWFALCAQLPAHSRECHVQQDCTGSGAKWKGFFVVQSHLFFGVWSLSCFIWCSWSWALRSREREHQMVGSEKCSIITLPQRRFGRTRFCSKVREATFERIAPPSAMFAGRRSLTWATQRNMWISTSTTCLWRHGSLDFLSILTIFHSQQMFQTQTWGTGNWQSMAKEASGTQLWWNPDLTKALGSSKGCQTWAPEC